MNNFRSGDLEPDADIGVLINEHAGQTRYLARLAHGWVWVNSKRDIDRPDSERPPTPVTWKFATIDDGSTVSTELRTLDDAEFVEWLAS